MDRGHMLCDAQGTGLSRILRRSMVLSDRIGGPRFPPAKLEETVSNPSLKCSQMRRTEMYPRTPKVTLAELIERYNRGETHAVTALYQLCQVQQFQVQLRETVTTGNVRGFLFAFCAVIDGVEYKTGMGKTKKEARSRAAHLALEDLIPKLDPQAYAHNASGKILSPVFHSEKTCKTLKYFTFFFPPPLCEPKGKNNPLNELILEAVKEKYNKLMGGYPEFSSCGSTLAAFVIQSCTRFDVVAIGTGDHNTRETVASDGRLLHDAHALITARRSLMRYLYRHLLLFFSKNPVLVAKSIFEQDGKTKLLVLKGKTTIHLYMNQLPKGAAQMSSRLCLKPLSISTWEVNNQMGLHVAVEGNVFSTFSSNLDQMSSKVVSMSASDKLTQWQVLGFQGALLSHLLEPIYVNTILIGDTSCSNLRGLEFALNQRVDGIISKLPMYYCAYRAHVGLVPAVHPTSTGGQRSLSMNWTQGDISFEIVDGLVGRSTVDSPNKSCSSLASRLCKAAMLSRFSLVTKESQRVDLSKAVSYREAKMMSKSYQEAKNLLKSHLNQKGYGSWVVKSPISDGFSA
ncbi:adenosine deaminase domain-containing protein 1 [Scleropages formosus]|uniref:adenosine deaminase domain-containing protein 1 n=1 Tax=Scleropages formosus TaxID=113540 RepID=UPI0010FAA531|nr:adenosine deaminase domain-containing protein 1 [Scleropages formosus]